MQKIDILTENGFNKDFDTEVFFNPDTYTVISEEFFQDNKIEKIKEISEKHHTDPTFYSSYGEPEEPLRTQLIKKFFPKYSSGLKSTAEDIKKRDNKE